jgi:FdhD protein
MWKKSVRILNVTDREFKKQNDQLALETKVEVVLNQKKIMDLIAMPALVKEMAIGYLVSMGYIDEQNDDLETCKLSLGTVEVCTKAKATEVMKTEDADLRVTNIDVIRLLAKFNEKSILYMDTGIAHRAAIATKKEILFFAEDINRLSAIDKVAGLCFFDQKKQIEALILISSGKITSEVVAKAGVLKLKIIVSRTGVTAQAAALAQEKDITLVGFARKKRFNIYTGEKRIVKG